MKLILANPIHANKRIGKLLRRITQQTDFKMLSRWISSFTLEKFIYAGEVRGIDVSDNIAVCFICWSFLTLKKKIIIPHFSISIEDRRKKRRETISIKKLMFAS